MATRTSIEWTRGADGSPGSTWNPITGCTKVSPGCDNCYAEALAERFRGTPGHFYEDGFDVVLRPNKLDQPIRWRKPRRIFVNSMSDLFHDQVPDTYIAKVWAVMALAPGHQFQILTKRHARLRALLNNRGWRRMCETAYAEMNHQAFEAGALSRSRFEQNRDKWWSDFHKPLKNVWIGVSVEDQRWADIRIPALLETPAAVRFLSMEPLLGQVDLTAAAATWGQPLGGIDWVIVGGESGRNARPMHPDWARSLRDQCVTAGVPFFMKQWGEWSDLAPIKNGRHDFTGAKALSINGMLYDTADLAYPDGPRRDEACREKTQGPSHLTNMYRVGKKNSGRELDGRTWDEYPTSSPAAAPAANSEVSHG